MITIVIGFIKFIFPATYLIVRLTVYQLLLYLSHITIPININIIPYCSLQTCYTLFDTKILVHKVAFYNKALYVAPFAIPIINEKIPRLYLNTGNGWILIQDLNLFNIKNNSINIEIKNLNLYKLLHNQKYKKVFANGNITLMIKDKSINCSIQNLNITNTPMGNLQFNGTYKNNKLQCTLDLLDLKHKAICNGILILSKTPQWSIFVESKTPIILNDIKCNQDILLTTKGQYKVKWKRTQMKDSIGWDIMAQNLGIKYQKHNISLGNVPFVGMYENNQLKCELNIPKWKHSILCNGKVNIKKKPTWNLFIKPKSPISINKMKISDNLFVNFKGQYNFSLQHMNKISGSVSINNGTITENINNKIINYISNFNTKIKLDNSFVNIERLYIDISNFIKGRIEAYGWIKLGQNNMDSKCNIKLRESILRNIPMFKGSIGFDINLLGNLLSNPTLEGKVTIKDPTVDLTSIINESFLSTQMITKFINKKDKKTKMKQNITLPISTNLIINIDPVLKAQGPGLTSIWKGIIKVFNEKNKPINWNAKLSLLKGQYTASGKKIKLTQGECISSQNIPGYLKLTLIGRKKSRNSIVGVKFTQQQNDTQIDFFSQPMKNKSDILSLLLFDKSSTDLSSSEAYSLGLVLQNLSSGKGNVFSKLNDLLKIDSIELKKNKSGTQDEYQSISLGKKIGKWHLNLEQGKGMNSTRFSVDRKITKNLKASVGTSRQDGIGAGIVWSKRY